MNLHFTIKQRNRNWICGRIRTAALLIFSAAQVIPSGLLYAAEPVSNPSTTTAPVVSAGANSNQTAASSTRSPAASNPAAQTTQAFLATSTLTPADKKKSANEVPTFSSPDGKIMIVSFRNEVFIVNNENGKITSRLKLPVPNEKSAGQSEVKEAVFAANGIVTLHLIDDRVYVLDTKTGKLTSLVEKFKREALEEVFKSLMNRKAAKDELEKLISSAKSLVEAQHIIRKRPEFIASAGLEALLQRKLTATERKLFTTEAEKDLEKAIAKFFDRNKKELQTKGVYIPRKAQTLRRALQVFTDILNHAPVSEGRALSDAMKALEHGTTEAELRKRISNLLSSTAVGNQIKAAYMKFLGRGPSKEKLKQLTQEILAGKKTFVELTQILIHSLRVTFGY